MGCCSHARTAQPPRDVLTSEKQRVVLQKGSFVQRAAKLVERCCPAATTGLMEESVDDPFRIIFHPTFFHNTVWIVGPILLK